MRIEFSSGNYDIICNGQTFLFEDESLVIDVAADDGFAFCVELKFNSDGTNDESMKKDVAENRVIFTCTNFHSSGTGLTHPNELGIIDGKRLYIMFWTYMEGSDGVKVRSIKYTFFYEKDGKGINIHE